VSDAAWADVPDTELISRAARGDAAAFGELVARHQAAVFRLTRTLTRDPAAAEDALQEAFLAAWRGAKGFRGDSSPRAWLLAIARNAARRGFRRRAGEPLRMESLDTLAAAAGWRGDADPEGLLLRRRRREALQAALDALHVQDREILIVRELEGLSGEETARVLGIGLAAVKSRLHRARLRLAARLRREAGDGE
jgi:RNA polymerase sigma-70 factor (ECF subfamily)